MLQDPSVLSSYCYPQANVKPGENVQNWAVMPCFGFLGLFTINCGAALAERDFQEWCCRA